MDQTQFPVLNICGFEETSSATSLSIRPLVTKLYNAYPNPFNPQTVISYTLPVNGQVELSVYDINGRQVTTLVNDNQQAGAYQVVFDGANLASGVYFYKLFTGNRIVANKMLLVR